jgi:hypothetical protein
MRLQLDRLPALRLQRKRRVGALLCRTEPEHAGVGHDAIPGSAPQFVERLVRRLPDQIPERDLDTSGAAAGNANAAFSPSAIQQRHVPVDVEWILADEISLHCVESTGVQAGTDADQSLVRVDFSDGAAARPAASPVADVVLVPAPILLEPDPLQLEVGDLDSPR